jgi:hypothetical protein
MPAQLRTRVRPRLRGQEIQAPGLDLFRRTYGVLARPEDRLVEWSKCLAQVVAIELPVTAVRAAVIAGEPSSDCLILGRCVILRDVGPAKAERCHPHAPAYHDVTVAAAGTL